jgi:hypothetical protein
MLLIDMKMKIVGGMKYNSVTIIFSLLTDKLLFIEL